MGRAVHCSNALDNLLPKMMIDRNAKCCHLPRGRCSRLAVCAIFGIWCSIFKQP